MNDEKYRSRKFLLAVFFAVTGTLALFVGKIDGAVWVSMVGLVLGLYGAANVAYERVKQ